MDPAALPPPDGVPTVGGRAGGRRRRLTGGWREERKRREQHNLRGQVVTMYMAGWDATTCAKQVQVAPRTVRNWIRAAMARVWLGPAASEEVTRQRHLARLDALIRQEWPRAMAKKDQPGDPKALARVLALMQEQAKAAGVYRPAELGSDALPLTDQALRALLNQRLAAIAAEQEKRAEAEVLRDLGGPMAMPADLFGREPEMPAIEMAAAPVPVQDDGAAGTLPEAAATAEQLASAATDAAPDEDLTWRERQARKRARAAGPPTDGDEAA